MLGSVDVAPLPSRALLDVVETVKGWDLLFPLAPRYEATGEPVR